MVIYSIGFLFTGLLIYFAASFYKRFYSKNIIYRQLKSGLSLTLQTTLKDNDLKNFTKSLFSTKHVKWKYFSFLFIILATIPLLIISTFRDYTVGTDTLYTYVPNYYLMYYYGYTNYREPIFNLIISLCTKISPNPTLFLFVTSIIYISFLIKAIVKHSDNAVLSIIIVFFGCFYFVFLNNMRQSLASIIMLYAFDCFSEKKVIKFIVFFLLAIGFHFSSFLIIVPFIMVNIKFIRKRFILFSIIFFALLPTFSSIFIDIINKTKYSYYFESEFNNNNANIANIVFNASIFLVSLFILNKRKQDRSTIALLILQFLATYVSCSSLFIRVGEMTSRITIYFSAFQILLIPKLYKTIKPTFIKISFITIMLAAYLTYMIVFIVIRGYHNVLPYLFI